jgi:hypothetical protein
MDTQHRQPSEFSWKSATKPGHTISKPLSGWQSNERKSNKIGLLFWTRIIVIMDLYDFSLL